MDASALSDDTLVLIDFYTDWCGTCQTMDPIIDELTEKHTNSLKVLKIDTDANPQVAAIYRIQSVPTFVLLKKGEVVWKKAGIVLKSEFNQLIQQHCNQ